MNSYCRVAVNSPFNNSFLTYAYPSEDRPNPGELFWSPLGKRKVQGIVLKNSLTKEEIDCDEDKIKSLGERYLPHLTIGKELLSLWEWVCNYYNYPLGQHVFDCLPRPLKRPYPPKMYQGQGLPLDFALNPVQEECHRKISEKRVGFHKWPLYGVTGGGKTAIYLSVINDFILQEKKSVLFLVPEINLTPQLLEVLAKHGHAPIYPYHSSLSHSHRLALWQEETLPSGPRIVVSARSGVFLPIKDLGLIIVDEEHDSSFKQEDRCRYNGKDVAIKRANMAEIPIILGSATPSLETYYHMHQDSNALVIKERAGGARPPEIELVDIRGLKEGDNFPFAPRSIESIKSALSKKEQVLVFINRLGHAHYIQCNACGFQFSCPNCSVNLKYYKKKNQLYCGYCKHQEDFSGRCPKCSNLTLLQIGHGTEKLATVLAQIFPDHRIKRFDRDEIKSLSQLDQRLEEFNRGEIDILVGTQMLSKGHNFTRVNLVLILGIDAQLNFPDFRASEKTFQLLVQVAGRSGRFGQNSRVLVQTLNPHNSIFSYLQNHELFYKQELKVRESCHSSPFYRMVGIYCSSRDNKLVQKGAKEVAGLLRKLKLKHFKTIEVLGPRPAMIEKKVNQYTWSILLRSKSVQEVHSTLKTLRNNFTPPKKMNLNMDIDPQHIY